MFMKGQITVKISFYSNQTIFLKDEYSKSVPFVHDETLTLNLLCLSKQYSYFQEAFLTKEHRSVQPSSLPSTSRGSISTMSRGSIKSDPFTEETSSISARSDTSADSLIFDPSFGKSLTTDTKLQGFFVYVPNDNMIVSIGKSKNQQQYFAFNCCLLVK